MKTSRTTKTILIISAVLLVGTAVAFAHGGGGWGNGDYGHMRGYGGHMMGPGYGGRMMDGSSYGPHMRGYGGQESLTDEQRVQLDEARDQFRKQTQEVRGVMEEKSVALRNEIIKEAPDRGKALKLQKEISALKADLDEQRLQHRLEVQKIAPNAFQGKGYGRGYGRGGGRGFGGGGYGYCR